MIMACSSGVRLGVLASAGAGGVAGAGEIAPVAGGGTDDAGGRVAVLEGGAGGSRRVRGGIDRMPAGPLLKVPADGKPGAAGTPGGAAVGLAPSLSIVNTSIFP